MLEAQSEHSEEFVSFIGAVAPVPLSGVAMGRAGDTFSWMLWCNFGLGWWDFSVLPHGLLWAAQAAG